MFFFLWALVVLFTMLGPVGLVPVTLGPTKQGLQEIIERKSRESPARWDGWASLAWNDPCGARIETASGLISVLQTMQDQRSLL